MPSRPDPSIGRPVPDRAGAHAERPGLDAILASYAAPAGHFDELMDGAGAVRPHWRRFAGHTPGLGADALGAVEAAAARQLHEDGVTYNVYADAGGPARPWALDVLPNVVPAAQWEPIARGLRQRARLLNALAADLYGPQRLLEEGLIPPALVHGHPGFLRACHGVAAPGGVYLHQVAFDLARGPDGRWWVAGTRTQAPSGAGYALENRLTVSRLFPDAFRELRVQRLAQFFLALQQALREGAPCDGEAPHIVLLTPGSYTETYFEHAYLARYLGFTLVEGGDLAVRDDRVYLKTLTGLERVHAILRRLDDDFCDPLELRPDSALGVPGLVQAWRAGHVLVANAFGAGRARVARALGVPARGRGAPARQAARAAVHPHVVVRRCGRARRGAAPPAGAGHQAGIPRRAHGARLRGRSRRGRPRAVDQRTWPRRPAATCSRNISRSPMRRSGTAGGSRAGR